MWRDKGEGKMKKIKGFLFAIGLIIVFGSVGSLETAVMSLGESIKMCLVGLPMMYLGAL